MNIDILKTMLVDFTGMTAWPPEWSGLYVGIASVSQDGKDYRFDLVRHGESEILCTIIVVRQDSIFLEMDNIPYFCLSADELVSITKHLNIKAD
nr:hypothetical protein [uncultured Arsenicibacter sp.]